MKCLLLLLLQSVLNQHKFIFQRECINYKGCDCRYNITGSDEEEDSKKMVDQIKTFLKKKAELEYLENKSISDLLKVERIQKLEGSLTAPNIKRGGLFKDWEADV
jgi:excinuclease UvrABC nuclease subunit